MARSDRHVRPARILSSPVRLIDRALPALAVAAVLMFIARPIAVFLCLAPFRFSSREKLFMSWVGLRGAVGIFLASIPLLIGLPNSEFFFDVGFVVVLASLLVQAWTVPWAAHRLHIALPRHDHMPGASNSTCRDSWSRRSSAIQSPATARIFGAAFYRRGQG